MTATSFNPLATARDLKAAGIEASHAEAIAEGMRDAAEAAANAERGDLATKADLLTAIEPLATKAELAEVRNELRADIADARNEIRTAIEPLATKAELRMAIEPLATKAELAAVRWILTFQGALVLAIAAKLFGIL